MFASTTLARHIARGAIGIGALYYAVAVAASYPWGSLALGIVALAALGGCPICWTIGLFETAYRQRSNRRQALNRRTHPTRVSP
jgi:hypothetical protein